MIRKVLKWSSISLVTLLVLLFFLPMIFPEKISQAVKQYANGHLNGELNFKEANLSFFQHFPALTLTLTDFSLKGSQPFPNENLVSSKEIALGINLKALIFLKKVNINQIYLSNAEVKVLVNPKGEANYNVYKSSPETKTSPQSTSSASLFLDNIDIKNAHLIYNDQSAQMLIDARGFNYLGKGSLENAMLNIYTKAQIDAFDFNLSGAEYLKAKKIDADLITRINTNSLAFVFEQNNLLINQLPVDFRGSFDFLKNGYLMDFSIKSNNSNLADVFTAFPPTYVQWLSKTDIRGKADFLMMLKGKYIVAENAKPDLQIKLNIRNGYVNHDKAPFPASNLSLHLDTQLPALNTDQLKLTVDSLFFNMGKDYFKGIVKMQGLQKPMVDINVQSALDLGKLHRALGLRDFYVGGVLSSDIKAKGLLDLAKHKLPVSQGRLVWQNGSLRTPYYPHPIEKINLIASIAEPTGQYKDLMVNIPSSSFVFEGNPFKINGLFKNIDDITYQVRVKGTLDLGRIYQVFAQKNLRVNGLIKADVSLKGKQSDATNGHYDRLQNSGILFCKNVNITSEYLPKPFLVKQGNFGFDQNDMNFQNFRAIYGKSDMQLEGKMQNVINFVLSDKAVVKGDFSINAKRLFVDEFMSATPNSSNSSTLSTGVVVIPNNFDFKIKSNIEQVNFQGLNVDSVRGNLLVNHGKLMLQDGNFEMIGTKVNMNISYESLNPKKALFDYEIKAKDFDIQRAYREVKLFREMATAAENAEGIVSLDYKIAGRLDSKMQPVFPSLVGGGILSVKDVKMKGYKLLSVVSKQTSKEGFENPNLKDVKIKTQIKNNIMTIERFKFKVAGFRPRIEGTTTLDGKLNLKMRLGLPPLGIIGIPMTITGTQTDPKVKVFGKSEKLEETEDKEVEE
ncbi:MAG: AsmA-like C-terminal region-containing protein [Arcicella sp.]|nr:AsmA-like C-terminal region-containing protein [Arcicella sp.]